MKKIIGFLGTALYWILWPVWYIYLRFTKKRSRVLVVCKGEVLLIKPWLGRKKFSLPGGGLNRGETARDAATRELLEETGIVITPKSLVKIGSYRLSEAGLKSQSHIFCVELNTKTRLSPQKLEVWEYRWVSLGHAEELNLSKITRYALGRYRPQHQERLL